MIVMIIRVIIIIIIIAVNTANDQKYDEKEKKRKRRIYSCSSICDNGAETFSLATCRCRFAARNFSIRDFPVPI